MAINNKHLRKELNHVSQCGSYRDEYIVLNRICRSEVISLTAYIFEPLLFITITNQRM